MAAPVLTSISPALGAPGTAITLTGTGFAAGCQAGCPSFVPTDFVDETQLTAAIPELAGAPGSSLAIAVFVRNPDGLVSDAAVFTVEFPRTQAQGWTTIDKICGEVPGFERGGSIDDSTIGGWVQSYSQIVTGALLARGLSIDPADWQQASADGAEPAAAAVLELIARYGAAAQLAGAVGALMSSGASPLQQSLQRSYEAQFKRLADGGYDKLFRPAAATEITGVSVATELQQGVCEEPRFRKDMVF